MGLDFRDFDNDGYPDIVTVALNNQTFPLFRNMGGRGFEEITFPSGMRQLSRSMGGYGPGLYDFDNDGWKDLFVTRGHVRALPKPGMPVDQYNTVFRNLGASGKWQALTEEAGLNASPPARHRGCAFADFDGDGRVDVVATALGREAEIWMNRSEGAGHWLDIALEGTKSNRDGIGALVKVVTKRRRTVQSHDHQRRLRFLQPWTGPFRTRRREQGPTSRDPLAFGHRPDAPERRRRPRAQGQGVRGLTVCNFDWCCRCSSESRSTICFSLAPSSGRFRR